MDNFASVTESDVFTALRAYILTLVSCPVIRTPVNRVAMPLGDFIAMTPKGAVAISTNTDTISATSETILKPLQYTVQVDCYGAQANGRANTISMLFRDDYACESFTASGFDMQPLYATDAQQMPLESGEDQYIERWTFDCVMQVNPVVTITVQTANTLTATLISVDRTYPA